MGRKFLFLFFFTLTLIVSKPTYASNWSKTNLNNDFIGSLETSIWGILAGENDQRLWNAPYNGIYISRDFGEKWNGLGLEGRGVNDIKYSNQKIYASTYYFVDGQAGLFASEDAGNTWQHLCENFSTSSVSVYENTVLLGTYSHGLWASNDDGKTWEQKLGSGYYGPEIKAIEINSELAITSTESGVYISSDVGKTWQKVTEIEDSIQNILLSSDFILLGGSNGLYKSTDEGLIWDKVVNWGDSVVSAISQYQNIIYAGKQNLETNRYDIYKSNDFGETWVPTNLPQIYNSGLPNNITWTFSKPPFIFTSVPHEGIYRYDISSELQSEQAFLNIPWQTTNKSELIDKIYSFFDHKYPLLGYLLFSEPLGTETTTLNYLGVEEDEPKFYYSSHNGYDFSLTYGTPVLAGYSGFASYGYDPNGLGHYITINHQNGYETTYAHLQDNELVTKSDNIWIETGQKIGLIGMSGNTTGPHLHFSIRKLNTNKPDGRVDPFGWQAPLIKDPWKVFTWTDSSGFHKGSESPYLWTFNPKTQALSNKQIIVDQNSHEQNFTIFIEPYAYPKVPITQNKLTYITGTSMLINIYNILGQEIPELLEPAIIEVDISNANTEDLLENTINIYTWNEKTSLWEPIPSFYNYLTGKVTGETKHFSKFAVFGISEDAWIDRTKIINTTITTQ